MPTRDREACWAPTSGHLGVTDLGNELDPDGLAPRAS